MLHRLVWMKDHVVWASCLPVRPTDITLVDSFSPCHVFFFHWHYSTATGNFPQPEQLRRGRSLLGREQDQHESGLAIFKRSATLRRMRTPSSATNLATPPQEKKKRGCWTGPGPGGPWMTYCYIITCLVPPVLMRACGTFTHPH